MYEFFNQGWAAYLLGIPLEQCPYEDGSPAAHDWIEGHLLSEQEELDEK
jgi:hypothetical protein